MVTIAGTKKTGSSPRGRGRSLVPVVAVLGIIICILSAVIIHLLPRTHNNRADLIGSPAGPGVTVPAVIASPEQMPGAPAETETVVALPDEPPILSPAPEAAPVPEAVPAPEAAPAPEASTDLASYFIFPDSDRRSLTEEDLCGLNEDSLLIARNEIYARRGRMFEDEQLQAYFDRQPWYTPTIAPDEFTHTILNDYEMWNASFILEYENRQ